MASVFLAYDTKHDRQVALKVLDIDSEGGEASDRFEREIHTIAGLQHPHILPLHDSGANQGLTWFVMPFVAEGTLRDRLQLKGRLEIAEALRIGREVAEALAYAHRQGVVHRDIKPENIMLDSGQAVVSDFGIAVLLRGGGTDRITVEGRSPGTPEYMSPEQADGERSTDPRVDLYATGCVLYEMLAGRPPFSGPSRRAILARKMVDPPPPLETERAGVPVEVERLVERVLAQEPDDRHDSAAELAADLGRLESLVRAADDGADLAGRTRPGSVAHRVGQVLTLAVGGSALLALVGLLSTTALDARLGLPATYTPSRADHIVVGARALVPVAIYGLAAVGLGLAVRTALRLVGSGLSATGVAMKVVPESLGKQPWSVDTVAELTMLATVGLSILVFLPFVDIYSALIQSRSVGLLQCERREHHILFQLAMPALIVVCGAARYGVLGWARRRRRGGSGLRFFRWLSAAWLLVLMVVTTLPWRTLFDAYYDRAVVDGVRAYVIRDLPDGVLAYTPETGSVRAVAPTRSEIEELGILGYAFEGESAFLSSQPKCDAIWNSNP